MGFAVDRQDPSGSPRNKELIRIPLVLKCGHTYCRSCIEQQVHSKPAFFCPVCQVTTKLNGSSTDGKISQLNYDFDMIGRLIAYRCGVYQVIREKSEYDSSGYNEEIITCMKCSMSPAQMFCLDCDCNYCSPCFQKLHFQSSGRLRKHVHIPTCKSGVIGQSPYCPVHGRQLLNMFCVTCEQGVCNICDHSNGFHKQHELMTYTAVFQRDLQNFKHLRPRVENLHKQAEVFIKKQRNRNSSSNQDDKMIEDIRIGFEHLHGILQMKENDLIRSCSQRGKQSSGNMVKHKNFAAKVMEDIDRLSRHETSEVSVPLNLAAISSQLQHAEDSVSTSCISKIKKDLTVQFDTTTFQEMLGSCVTVPGLSRGSSRATSHSSGHESVPNYTILKRNTSANDSTESILQQPSRQPLKSTPIRSDGPPLDLQMSYAVVDVETGNREEPRVLDEQGFPLTLPTIEKRNTQNAPIGNESSKRIFEAVKKVGGCSISQELVTGDDVVVIHIAHPNSFFVQKTSSEKLIQKVFDECQIIAKKRARPLTRFEWSRLEHGDSLMAQYTDDMNWYRARVVEISESLPRKVKVFFVDYGNSSWIEMQLAQKLSDKLETIGDLALQCSLDLLPRTGDTWKTDDNRVFHRQVMLTTAEYMIRVNGHDQRSDLYTVDLMRRTAHSQGPLSIRDWLVLREHARFPEAGNELKVVHRDDFSNAVLPETDRTIDVEDLPCDDGPIMSCDSDEEHEQEHMDNSESEAVLAHQGARMIHLPDNSNVRVSRMQSLNEIWLAPVCQARSMIFQRDHPALHPESEYQAIRPHIGGLYAVRYSDGLWYRAVMEKVGEEEVVVRSVDFGVTWSAEWRTAVVKLQRKYLVEPYRAHCLCLAGITFQNRKRIPSLKDDVEKMLFAKPSYRLIYGPATHIGTPNGNCVYLVNEEGCLNLSLVEKELAEFADRRQLDLIIELCPESVPASELDDFSVATDSSDAPTITTENPSISVYDVQDQSCSGGVDLQGQDVVNVVENEAKANADHGPSECDVVLLCEDDVCRLPWMPPCHITRFETPGEFYVRMTDSESMKMTEKLTEMLHEKYCRHSTVSRENQKFHFDGGEIVAVKRPGEPKWHRGRVLGESSYSPDLIQVLLVDYGYTISVPHKFIINPLDSSLIYGWNEMAVKCHVMGVQASGGGEWEDSVIEKVERILKRCDFRGQVSRIAEESHSCGVDLVMKEVIRGSPDDDEHSETEDDCSLDSSVTRYISLRETLLDMCLVEPLPLDESKIRDRNLHLRGCSLVRSLPQGDSEGPPTESFSAIENSQVVRANGDVNQDTSGSLTGLDIHLFQENNNFASPEEEKDEEEVKIVLQSPHSSPGRRHLPVPNNLVGSSPGASSPGSEVGNGIDIRSTAVLTKPDISPPGTQFLIDGPPLPSSPERLRTPELPQVDIADPSPLNVSENQDVVDVLPSRGDFGDFPAFTRQVSSMSSTGDDEGVGRMLTWKWPVWWIMEEMDGIEVLIQHVDKEMIFICEPLLSDNLRDAVTAIEIRASGDCENLRLPPKTHITEWLVGEACMAYSEKKERWCRAQIVAINYHGHTANIYFIDYGDSAWLLSTLLCPIAGCQNGDDHPYLSVLPAVWRVKLQDIYPVNQSNPNDLTYRIWRESDTSHICGDLTNTWATLYVVDVDKTMFQVPTVVGRITSEVTLKYVQVLPSPRLCLEVALSNFIASYCNEYDVFTDASLRLEFCGCVEATKHQSLHTACQTYGGNELGEYLCDRSVAYRWETSNPDQLFVKSPPTFVRYPNLDPFPVGVPLEVIVSAVETPNELYLQTTFSEQEAIAISLKYPEHVDWFMEMGRVNDYVRRSETDIIADNLSSLFGEYGAYELDDRIACVAKYSVDQTWYRAELAYAKADSRLMRVHFVDYGNYDDVPLENIREAYQTDASVGCRRYRWRNVRRHSKCELETEDLKNILWDTLTTIATSGLYVKCERIYRDGRLPHMDLYRDKECTIPIIDLLETQRLVQRSEN